MADNQVPYRTPQEQYKYYHDTITARGLVIWGMSGDKSIIFTGVPNSTITCKVYLNSGDFEFDYMIPHTTFRITSDKMGPFSNQQHFMKNLDKFVAACSIHDVLEDRK